MEYNTATLPNGLRVIHRKDPSAVVFCGYQIAVGTRHERPGQEGLAHFCEHTTFKGTARRSSLQILNALESVGGELNAFTTKERTVYYAATMKEHLGRTIDLLGDIVFNSVYPQAKSTKRWKSSATRLRATTTRLPNSSTMNSKTSYTPDTRSATTFWAMPMWCVNSKQKTP